MLEFLTKRDWLGHIVEALVMAVIVGLLFLPWEIAPLMEAYGVSWLAVFDTFWQWVLLAWKPALISGIIFACGHFHGREKRDYEVSVTMRPPHLAGYFFWRWNKDQLTDFFPVLGVGLIAIYFLIQ